MKSSRTTGRRAARGEFCADCVLEVGTRAEATRKRPQKARARPIELLMFIVKFPMNCSMKLEILVEEKGVRRIEKMGR